MQCELAGLHPGCSLLCGHLPHLWLRAPRALESWHTWQPRPARPRRPDLELAGACQLPDQNQYTRRLLPKFQVQRSPMRASVRQMGNFWVVGSRAPLVERPAALLSGWRPSPPSRCCLGGGARNLRPLVTSLTPRTISAPGKLKPSSSCLYARRSQERSLFTRCRTGYFRLVIPGLAW